MLMVSNGLDFWGTDTIAPLQVALVHPDGTLEPQSSDMSALKGKSVVVLFHGYDNEKPDVLARYFKIKENLGTLYDAVIGYRMPLCDETLEYWKAEGNANNIAPCVGKYLAEVASIAKSVDVIAHSMGNRVVLKALQTEPALQEQSSLINRIFCFAPAIDNESVEKGEMFRPSERRCREVVVFYSKNDTVLQRLYPLAKLDRALGYSGAEHPYRLPSNVQQVDCTDVVSGHSAYFDAESVFQFIRNKASGTAPPASEARSLILQPDGTAFVITPSMLERIEETVDHILHGQK